MKVLTIKSEGILDEELQTEIHFTFGMELNIIERYHLQDGNVKEQLRSGWKWDR